MKYRFKYDPENKQIQVNNLQSDLLEVFFMDVQRNKGIYRCQLTKRMFGVAHIPEDVKDCYIYINDNNTSFIAYKVDMQLNDVIKVEKANNFNFNNPFVFIGGHTGGGTSVVVKALRSLNIHFGDDCGDFENRKAHESSAMRFWLYSLNEEITIEKNKQKLLDLINLYNYKDNKINCFKVPGDSMNKVNEKVYRVFEVLPNTKFISVIRKRNNFFSTPEGSSFNKRPDNDIIEQQYYKLEGSPIFHLDFYKFFTDYNYFNKILKYIGYTDLLQNPQQLESIKVEIGFDNKVLD